MIIQNGGIDAVEKWIEKEKKRSEQLNVLITADNKETVVKILEIVYDRVMDCEGTLLTESGEKVANVIDGQDAMDAICCTIEEVKGSEPKELKPLEVDTTPIITESGYTIRTKDGTIEMNFVIDNGGKNVY